MFQKIKNLIISFDIQEVQAENMAQKIFELVSEPKMSEVTTSLVEKSEKEVIVEDVEEVKEETPSQEEPKKRGRKKST